VQQPNELFTYESHVDPRPIHATTLVVTLGAYGDPGHTQQLVDTLIVNHLDSTRIGHFDTDKLVDYRSLRPTIVFAGDRFTEYHRPEMTLLTARDSAGTPFLLLRGPEPDFRWEETARAIEQIVEDHDVETTVVLHGVAMPTPHTRPVTVTRWASDPALLPGNQPMFGSLQLRASFPQMLALRLGEAGHHVIGLSAHIPQYVAMGDYPDGALAVISALREVSSLEVPTGNLQRVSAVVRAELDQQTEQDSDVSEMVTGMEEQYDRFVAGHRPLPTPPTDLPSADQIGEEAEAFLRGLDGPEEGTEPGTDE